MAGSEDEIFRPIGKTLVEMRDAETSNVRNEQIGARPPGARLRSRA